MNGINNPFVVQPAGTYTVVRAGSEADVQVTWPGPAGDTTRWTSSNPAVVQVSVWPADSTKAHLKASGPGRVQILVNATLTINRKLQPTAVYFDLLVVAAGVLDGSVAVITPADAPVVLPVNGETR